MTPGRPTGPGQFDREDDRTMSRIATPKPAVVPGPRPKTKGADVTAKPKESMRDFVEQIVIAFMLAFLIRGFDAEAFVIPTGSMAPTLMGRHKEVTCPECGYLYSVNASDETEEYIRRGGEREVGICGNCRYRTDINETPSFKGDRILVMKFPYEMPTLPGSSGPRRWDVVVFHYPEKPETNYIKRLVGMPGDDLRIVHGDIQTKPTGTNAPFQIERKPLIHQDAMQMLVYDDAYRPKSLADQPEWRRWRAENGWTEEQATPGTFAAKGAGPDGWADLRYRHLVPDPEQWAAVQRKQPLPRAPRPTLITDFYAYNTNISPAYGDPWLQKYEGYLQPNWVGDLTVSARIEVANVAPQGRLRLELIEAGVSHRCEVDLATGQAVIFRGDQKLAEAKTALSGAGSHDVRFANVDDRLTLWVDGTTPFEAGVSYEEAPNVDYIPTARDLDPVGIAVRGADAKVSGLVLQRDIYYTQDPRYADYNVAGVQEAVDRNDPSEFGRAVKLFDFLGDPNRFGELKNLATHEAYVVRPDHYMMMGDNSPRSSDSRAWEGRDTAWRVEDRLSWEVPRSLLIGKAFFIYWPHGKPFGPDIRVNRDFRIPFRPYVERMRWIR